MRLSYKRTVLTGFAFFLIMIFWQAYDSTVPLILTNKFGMSQSWSGIIMAADNVLAVFMLPVLGTLSDKCDTPFGKRTPFIAIGTVVAAVALVGLSLADNAQLANIAPVSGIDDPAGLQTVYDAQGDYELLTPEGERFVLSQVFTREEFSAIESKVTDETGKSVTNRDYTNYVVPARQAWAWQATMEHKAPLVAFVVLLLIALVAMATFRSPAVALMPDVTVKPLRSKANAVINLMGTAGGILVLVLGIVFSLSAVENSLMSYTAYYGLIAALMLGALAVFLLTVREKKWAAQMREESLRLGIEEDEPEEGEKRGLTAGERRSLIFMLLSITLWYFGYNAITSKYSVYATNILHKDFNTTLLIAQGAAIVSYLPAGMVASRIGRKKTIMAGVVMLTGAFAAAAFMRSDSATWLMNVLFSLAGIGWATINVNSFPMVVEMCSGADTGKYTGIYYAASMSAQIVTPMLSGLLMDRMGMTVLFPYAAVFAGLAFVTMALVRHGDVKVQAKTGLEALNIED